MVVEGMLFRPITSFLRLIQVFRKQFRLSLWDFLPTEFRQSVCVPSVIERALVINESLGDYLVSLGGEEAEDLKDPPHVTMPMQRDHLWFWYPIYFYKTCCLCDHFFIHPERI